ncbi:hypothetical protein FRB97_007849 [Tulasnella sp. 331]|nr:hypothetical protein FRB97_007849 [Tulasnella sp. 331]
MRLPLPLLVSKSSTSNLGPSFNENIVQNTSNHDITSRASKTFSSIPKSITLSHHYSFQRRWISYKTVGKVAMTAGFLGLLGWAFNESGKLVKSVTAGPDEGAFTSQQEQVVKMWFEHEPTQLWEGDQAMQRIEDTPNVSQEEIDMFAGAWKVRQAVIIAQTAAGNPTTTLPLNGSIAAPKDPRASPPMGPTERTSPPHQDNGARFMSSL